ncbi:MAG TPA: helix-turn-helix transcriptional regulator [Myxococcota bacterium]|nr:helix-turn-helix transcriptional regulator [Myxococcota bacterium]
MPRDTSQPEATQVGAAAFLAATRQLVRQLPGLVILKDLDSRILEMNGAVAALLGIPLDVVAEGRFEWELAPFLAPYADAFRAQDQETLRHARVRFIDVVRYSDGAPRVILSEKVRLDDAAGRPCALLFQGTEVSGPVFGRIGALLLEHIDRVRAGASGAATYTLDWPAHVRQLSAREAECLFFLLRGQTARSIAERLHLSVRTVESYIVGLKNTFGCDTKVALIEAAIAEGYSSFLPPSILGV